MNSFEVDVDSSDELGPGSDLVISLFAVAMLILGMVGFGVLTGSGNPDPGTASTPGREKLAEELVRTSQVNEELRAILSAKDEEIERLKQDKVKVGDVARATLVNEDLQARLATKDREIERLKEDKAKISNVATTTRIPPEAIVSLKDSAGHSLFSLNSAELTEEGRMQLMAGLVAASDKLQKLRATVIEIEGFSSPEPRLVGDRDTNPLLAFQRTEAVAEALVDIGFSRRCLKLVSYGRDRSKILSEWRAGASDEEVRTVWDHDPGLWSKFGEDRLAGERRVELRATADPASPCAPEELTKPLGRIPTRATTPSNVQEQRTAMVAPPSPLGADQAQNLKTATEQPLKPPPEPKRRLGEPSPLQSSNPAEEPKVAAIPPSPTALRHRYPEGPPQLEGIITNFGSAEWIYIGGRKAQLYGIEDNAQTSGELVKHQTRMAEYLRRGETYAVCYRRPRNTYRCYVDDENIADTALKARIAERSGGTP